MGLNAPFSQKLLPGNDSMAFHVNFKTAFSQALNSVDLDGSSMFFGPASVTLTYSDPQADTDVLNISCSHFSLFQKPQLDPSPPCMRREIELDILGPYTILGLSVKSESRYLE